MQLNERSTHASRAPRVAASHVALYRASHARLVRSFAPVSTNTEYQTVSSADVSEVSVPHAQQVLEWMRANQGQIEKYAGQWIAIKPTGIVGTAPSLSELRKRVGRKDITVVKVPARDRMPRAVSAKRHAD